MVVVIPWSFTIFTVIVGVLYFRQAKKRDSTGKPLICIIFLTIWSFIAIIGIFTAIPMIPGPRETNVRIDPSPETIFGIYIAYILVPVFVLLFIMIADLIRFYQRK